MANARGPAAEDTPAKTSGLGVQRQTMSLAGNIESIVADRLAAANDPVRRKDCHRKGFLFHVFIVVVLLTLLWACYLGLKVMGDNDDEPNFPWSTSLQLITTVALLQSLVAHFVSTLPCLFKVHWNVIVIGNLVNAVVFSWIVWFIIAATSTNYGSPWPVVVTVVASAGGCITTAAACVFCPEHDDTNTEPKV